jgi:hypothetical protein
MLCTRNACWMRGFASTSTLASTQAPSSSMASFSSTGVSCLQGPHHSAQKSMTTGVESDRSSTSVWNVASVTSMMTAAPPGPDLVGAGLTGDSAAGSLAPLGAALRSRRPLRSTAPRMIDGIVRGSMVV